MSSTNKDSGDNGSGNNGFGRTLRIGLMIAVVVGALAGLAVLLGQVQQDLRSSGTSSSAFRIGGPFKLTSHLGETFSSEALKGRPHMVFFGFTHCPDICPTTLQEVSTHMADLGAKADELLPLFITVDPERDTADALKAYLESFDRRIVGLTGSGEDIKHVTKLYRAYFEKIEGTDGDYSMNHTASAYLFDRRGNLVSTMNWQEKAEAREAKLAKALAR